MVIRKIGLLLGFVSLLGGFALADSITATGTAEQGNASVANALSISGPGLNLFETSFDGPSVIGVCNVGTCNTSFTIGDAVCEFQGPCATGYASGSVAGFGTAQWLVTSLVFSGSFSYDGGTGKYQGPVSFAGTILGYDLVNCAPTGYACQLGQEVFSLVLSGQGTATYNMAFPNSILGVTYNYTALITPTPEPSSILLVGCGLAAMWIIKRNLPRLTQEPLGANGKRSGSTNG